MLVTKALILVPDGDRMTTKPNTRNMALYCDFENVALGVRDAKYAAFNIQKVLERLLLKGNIVAWSRRPIATGTATKSLRSPCMRRPLK